MSLVCDTLIRRAEPAIADVLEGVLAGEEVSAEEGALLYSARGADMHLVGMVADELRRRACGDTVTYVINRNINFTNVCVKRCLFCAFSRDHRTEEGYMLPVEEVARRAAEAHEMGATEVCIQAGLPPDMEPDLYERICAAVKRAAPGIHIHAFSPEEVLYGATAAGTTVEDFVIRLKDAGVDTLPGTSAEILDQGIRDRISPGRISVEDWIRVIRAAHRAGITTTSTMMFGHVEDAMDRTRHMATIRDIQRETRGFTEFVPLNFVHEEAPLGARESLGARHGAGAPEILLTHAIARIMLAGHIENIQMSWVKDGPMMARVLLHWGANDFGGTLINESISTSAGARHGQLLRPAQIRQAIRDAGRVPAQRLTDYTVAKEYARGGDTEEGALDAVADESRFGSYEELVSIDTYRYRRARRGGS